MVLADLKLSAAKLEAKEGECTIDQGLCIHWLLNGEFFSLMEPCSMCSKSWGSLLRDCIERNISFINGAYAFNFLNLGNFLSTLC